MKSANKTEKKIIDKRMSSLFLFLSLTVLITLPQIIFAVETNYTYIPKNISCNEITSILVDNNQGLSDENDKLNEQIRTYKIASYVSFIFAVIVLIYCSFKIRFFNKIIRQLPEGMVDKILEKDVSKNQTSKTKM